MRGTLQYVYSISVFLGVLVTSYLMMNRDNTADVAGRAIAAPALRSEASTLAPGLSQLMEMEDAITKFRREPPEVAKKRAPSDIDGGRDRAAE